MIKYLKVFKYLLVFTLPLLAYISFNSRGWLTFAPLIEAFVLIPLVELLIQPDRNNLSQNEEIIRKEDVRYDLLLYLVVPVQFVFIYLFLLSMQDQGLTIWEQAGRISSLGLMCGVMGINVAHELGHRNTWYEQMMSKMLLLSSLYMHFFIEHNRGHHKNVSTEEDPASSREGENVYGFWVRSVINSYISAWSIENARLRKKNRHWFHLENEMLQYQIIQGAFLGLIFSGFGVTGLMFFLSAAVFGFLLLETVNYIEHYGLQRKKTDSGVYERVMPVHSWNSDHIVGRMFLFELSRHSDHHYMANRKYQLLQHIESSPQMPTGYPGMMLMALVPPLWFRVMNKELREFNTANV